MPANSRPFNPLLDTLPPVIKVGDPEGSDQGWLGQFIRFAIVESAEKRAGGESVLAKLSELMFIEVIRRYIETLPPEQSGLACRLARSLHWQGAGADAPAASP